MCEEHIDGATLYFDDPGATSAEDETVDAGRWAADPPVTSVSTWSLNEPRAGWTATLALGVLQPDRTYTLYGWTNDNSGSTGR